MEVCIRKAGEVHRQEIARCIAEGFEKDFSVLSRDSGRVAAAIRCYTRLGFREFRRVPEKHPKQKSFGAKIYMRYEEETP